MIPAWGVGGRIRNLSESTRKGYAKHIRGLGRKTDLNNPIETESYILDLKCTHKYKNNLLTAYWYFCKANQITWQKPKSLKTAIFPVKISTEERINMIIACATPKYAVVYNLSKYGLRPDEVSKITLRDLDLERGEVNIRTSKMGLERTLHLKNEVRDLLRDYVNRYKITNLNQKLLSSAKKICEHWRKFRKKAYDKRARKALCNGLKEFEIEITPLQNEEFRSAFKLKPSFIQRLLRRLFRV
jgi:integrase